MRKVLLGVALLAGFAGPALGGEKFKYFLNKPSNVQAAYIAGYVAGSEFTKIASDYNLPKCFDGEYTDTVLIKFLREYKEGFRGIDPHEEPTSQVFFMWVLNHCADKK